MKVHRVLALALSPTLAVSAACADSSQPTVGVDGLAVTSSSTGAPVDEEGADEARLSDDASATAPSLPTTSAVPATTVVADHDTDGWAAQLVAVFEAFDDERERLDEQVSDELGDLPPDATEAEFFAVLAAPQRGLADAGDVLLAEVPPAVPADFDETYRSTVDAFVALTEQRRRAADGLEAGDPTAYNELREMTTQFDVACSELQFMMLDLGHGLLPCGIEGEEPGEPSFVDRTTIDETDVAARVEVPPGTHVVTYLGEAVPEAPAFELTIDSDGGLEIATSVAIAELSDPGTGAALRVHVEGLVADVTQLRPDSIPNFWTIPEGPGGWIGALDGVRIDATGSGEIAGVEGEFWELTSERDGPIAVLGDGQDWVVETILEPGQTIRLWWVQVGGWPVLITEHAPPGATLADADDDLSVLRDAVTLTAP
ncbi:MAG: hypothetical protein HKN41_11985 [Ilumatobacter sp.]|nr:hypothetical protein [Ilumatobacter sp.]